VSAQPSSAPNREPAAGAVRRPALPADHSDTALADSYRRLADVFHLILAEQDLSPLLERIADTLEELIPHDTLSIYEADEAQRVLHPVLVRDQWEEEIMASSTLFGEGLKKHDHHDVEGAPPWLEEAREALVREGDYLAFADDERVRVVPLQDGWTRIGRSLSAHVRFDDPTVSRRHALLYREEGGARILDDRSLNGVFKNGERVELAELEDGDEIGIGRFRLFYVSLSGVRSSKETRTAFA